MIYEIELPYPHSVNHIYGYVALGRNKLKKYLTKEYKKYREQVARAIVDSGLPQITGAIALRIYIYTPDRKKRDLDNVNKALFDSCTEGKLWDDDSFVVYSESFKYYDPDKQGRVVLKIKQVEAHKTKSGAWMKGE